jgi:hypothetical protein
LISRSQGDVSAELNHPALGNLTLTRDLAAFRAANGQSFFDRRASLSGMAASLGSGLQADFSWVKNALASVHSKVAEVQSALDSFGAADVSATFLVIPGVSAFRAKIGPLEFGPLAIPRIEAAISLRDIAIDVSKGSFAFQLMIPDGSCLDTIIYAHESLSFAVTGATLFLDADAVTIWERRRELSRFGTPEWTRLRSAAPSPRRMRKETRSRSDWRRC